MANFKGKVERVRNNIVEGWAWHEGPDSPEVILYIDGDAVAKATADRMRGDLRDAGIGDGRGGFLIPIPPERVDGALHRLSIKITGKAEFLNAVPVMAVLRDEAVEDAKAKVATPPPPAKTFVPPVVKPVASSAGHIISVTRGTARVAVAGTLGEHDLPARITLNHQTVTITRLDDDGGFVAVFDLPQDALAETIGLNGMAIPVTATTASVHAAVAGRDDVTAIHIPLDTSVSLSSLRLRTADRATLHLATDDRAAVFGITGPLAAGVTVPVNVLVRAAQARDSQFALHPEAALDIAVVDADGQVLAEAAIFVTTPVRFHLEQAGAERIVGWMVRRDAKTPDNRYRHAEIDMFLDGVRYATLTGDRHRQDVINAGHAIRGGGFDVSPLYPLGGTARLNFAPRFSRHFLDIKATTINVPAPLSRLGQVYGLLREAPAVTVLVPVRNDGKDLRQRLDDVLKYTSGAHILVLDDASSDDETLAVLESAGATKGVTIHREARSLGGTALLNRGIELAGRNDVVIVSAGVSVGPGWLEGLRAAAWSDPRIATATPSTNHGGGFSVPEVDADNALPPGMRSADVARLVRQSAAGIYPRVPVGGGFCLYVRRDCLDDIGGFDATAFPRGGEDMDLCLRAGRAGYLHVIDDRTFVYNRRWAPANPSQQVQVHDTQRALEARYPEYAALAGAFATSEAMLAMRWQVRKAWLESKAGQDNENGQNREAEASVPRPRIAYVISTRSGGTPQTNRDLMQAISDRYEPWVLICDSRSVELIRLVDGREETVTTLRLDTAVRPASHRSSDYDDAVSRLLLAYGFEMVHIRHLGWHGIDLAAICRTLGVPVVLSLHDFYTVCPNIKLLDQDQVFCGGKCTPTAGECGVELWPQSEFPQLKHHFIHRWQAMFADVFPACDALVTTSDSARDIVRKVYPAVAGMDFRVIPHGRSFSEIAQLAVKPRDGERLRVLVPGNISPAKGSDLINAMIALDTDKAIEFHLLGDPGLVVEADTVVRHGLYRREDFAARVAVIRPHIGAVLSIWPETYCHTLTEMWACGLPVVGVDIGAVGERLREHGGGWRLPLGADARQALDNLLATADDWDMRAGEVRTWQTGYGLTYGAAEMADAYDALYRDLWRKRVAVVQAK